MMKCIEIRDQKLVLTERPVPEIKSGEVLVKVYAAGVNRPDLLQRKGLYPPPPGVTDIPGLEIAGEIVKGRGKGKKVCALVSGGGYAGFCAVPEGQCLPLPKGMDFTTAAGIPETFFTVWANLVDIGKIKKGDSVLIHGGASGIGTTAIQVARTFGAKVFVTAGTGEKCKACKILGAHLAINYKTQDFVAEILKATRDKGVDIVLDMIGGDYVPRNLEILASGGRHISIAMQHGRKAEIDIFSIMSKRLTLTGSTLRPRSVEEKTAIADALHKNIWHRLDRKRGLFALLSRKRILPVIDRVFDLKDAQAAHAYLEAGAHVGKVILNIYV
jgi:NADPH2:quinone reductase